MDIFEIYNDIFNILLKHKISFDELQKIINSICLNVEFCKNVIIFKKNLKIRKMD